MDPALFLRYAPGGGTGHHLRRQCGGLYRGGGAPAPGREGCAHLAFSSGLSTTCNSAEVAMEGCGSSIPSGSSVWWIPCAPPWGRGCWSGWPPGSRRGRSIEEVRDWAETHKQAVCHQFTVQDQFLKRGGRITLRTAVLGSMLQIKPLLHVDQGGQTDRAVRKAQGRHAA